MTTMQTSPRHILNVAILRHAAETGDRLPLEGWAHFHTDDIGSRFHYDRAPEDGPGWLVVAVDDNGIHIDWSESFVTDEARSKEEA